MAVKEKTPAEMRKRLSTAMRNVTGELVADLSEHALRVYDKNPQILVDRIRTAVADLNLPKPLKVECRTRHNAVSAVAELGKSADRRIVNAVKKVRSWGPAKDFKIVLFQLSKIGVTNAATYAEIVAQAKQYGLKPCPGSAFLHYKPEYRHDRVVNLSIPPVSFEQGRYLLGFKAGMTDDAGGWGCEWPYVDRQLIDYTPTTKFKPNSWWVFAVA